MMSRTHISHLGLILLLNLYYVLCVAPLTRLRYQHANNNEMFVSTGHNDKHTPKTVIIPFGGLAKFDESAVCPYYIAHAA